MREVPPPSPYLFVPILLGTTIVGCGSPPSAADVCKAGGEVATTWADTMPSPVGDRLAIACSQYGAGPGTAWAGTFVYLKQADHSSTEVVEFNHQTRLGLTWLDPTHLEVVYGPGEGGGTTLQSQHSLGVSITLREASAPIASADPDTAGCMFQPKPQHADPGQLLDEYLRRDEDGEFLSSSQWDLGARTCPGREAGFDAATVITSYRVGVLRSTPDTVWFSVAYEVLGHISDDSIGGLTVAPATETDTFPLIRTTFGWRISSTLDLDPHILPRIAAELQTRTRDRRILDSVAQETRAVWGVAVMPFEASPSQLQPQADSARAHVVSVLRGAGIRLVNRPPSMAHAGPLLPARFAVVGTLTANGDSINVDAKLINVETTATVRRVNLTGPFRGAAALGEMVGRIVSLDIQAAGP